MRNQLDSLRRQGCIRFSIAAVIVLALASPLLGDHRDGPIFENTAANGRLDIGDLFVFRSPTNVNNTVLIMTVSPFTGDPPLNCVFGSPCTPRTFREDVFYEFRIAPLDFINVTDELTFRVTFGPPDGTGTQDVLLRALPAIRFETGIGVLAKGRTGQNLVVTGGGMFRAGNADDPFFFDEAAFESRLNGGAFPRPVGTARNFYGPDANILAIVLELPSSKIGPNNSIIAVWARTVVAGVQQDREGKPFVNKALIPPIPRGSNFPIGTGEQNRAERRNAFNAAHPRDDRANFRSDMLSVLQSSFYGRTLADSNVLADLFLPDVLLFQMGNPDGLGTFITSGTGQGGGSVFGNGRRLRDDVTDIMMNTVTNGAITTDNVPDDNGTRITDGNFGTIAAFPYIAAPSATPGGPNP